METDWKKLPVTLLDEIYKTISDLGFTKMMPVQAACIPQLLGYKDVAAEAVTGSGKTLAFVIPIIQLLLKRETKLLKHDIGALIISPTRELATQIHEVVQCFLKYCPGMTSLLTVGGTSVNQDLSNYNNHGGHIVVATPGRIDDLLSRKSDGAALFSSGVKSLEILILDEADRLLDLGFKTSINTILAFLPKLRRTGLFSATQTTDVINLIRAGLRNPIQVRVKENDSTSDDRTPTSLNNYYMSCEFDQKFSVLSKLLKEYAKQKIIIFFSTCACVEYFSTVIQEIFKNINVFALHGKMKDKRFKVFDKFREAENGIMICTDVMCRGVDIPQVDWVIQYDPPSSAASFVHRCGRTARGGEAGSAIVLLLPNELDYVEFIKLNQKVTLQPMDTPTNLIDNTSKIHKIQLKDRSVFDKANRAFVSYIQSYIKHECNLILNIKHLDLGLIATGFGLLNLPKMPELKNVKITSFKKYPIDLNTIPYKDKQKEKVRLVKLKEYEETGQWPGFKAHIPREEAWSKKRDLKEKKRLKKEQRQKKKRSKFSDEDLNELANDLRMIKKLKTGKVTEDEFDQHFGCETEMDSENATKESSVKGKKLPS